MNGKGITIGLIALLLAFAFGCSGGSGPISPQLQIPGIGQSAPSMSNTLVWGLWQVSIDPVSGTADIVPVRGAEFTANVTQFMQPPIAKQNLLGIKINPGSDIPTGYLDLDVTFTHPFPGLDMYTGFDVRGICIGNGSIAGLADSNILYGGADDLQVLNADGMTRWYNPFEFTTYETIFGFTRGKLGGPTYDYTATLNGYKYYGDDLGAEDDATEFFADPSCANPRGLFSAGNVLSRNFVIQFPVVGGNPVLNFQYAVVASWEPPDPNPPMIIPDDFPISANCHEAYCVSAVDQSDMFYIDPSNKGGTLSLMVRVFDHQGAVSGSGVSAEVKAIHLETPDGLITTGGIATFDSGALAGALYDEDGISATWLLEVTDVDPDGPGDVPVLVVVESVNPDSYDSGFAGFAYPDGALATYIMASVNVTGEVQSQPPVAVAEIVTSEPWCPDDPIEFDGSNSYDQDEGGNIIVSWEWDFDGDGTYGDSYDSGTDDHPVKVFDDFGVYEIDLLVTDDEGETDTLDELLSISIGGATWVDDDAVPPYDGSFENPWLTIQEGIDNATSDCGDKWVLVKDGTYVENISIPSNITVEGYSTPAPLILQTVTGSDTHAVNFGSSINSTIKHFQLEPRLNNYGISVGGLNNTVDDIEFIDNPGDATCSFGIRSSGTGNTVKNVRTNGYHITAGGGTSFIYVSGGDTTVVDCVVLNINFTNADSGWGPNVFTFSSGNANSLCARNVVGHYAISGPDAAYPRVRAFYVSGCNGSTIRNNLVFDYDNNQTGGWTRVFELSGLTNLKVERNTISGVAGPAWIYGMYAPSGDSTTLTMRNNIITNLTAGTMNWRWAHNGYLSPIYYVDYSCSYNVGNDFSGNFAAGTGYLSNQNPMFVNPSSDDYQLQSGSPCIGTAHDGTDMGAYGGSDPLTWVP